MKCYSIDFTELIEYWLYCLWCAMRVVNGSMNTRWWCDFVSSTSFVFNHKAECGQLPEQLFYYLVAMSP